MCYSIEPWALKWAKEIPTRIGHAILSEDETSLILSNLLDGLDHYSFPSLERVQTFPYPISQNYPMQVVTTGSRSRWIVSGGDDGFARVYDRCNGHLIASLTHGPPGALVQVVAATSGSQTLSVVTGSSGLGSTDIKVWSTPPADRNDAIVHEKSATELHRRHIVFIVIATATAVTILKNTSFWFLICLAQENYRPIVNISNAGVEHLQHQPCLRARGDVQEADSGNDSPTVFPPSKITNICNAFSRLTLREDTAAPSSVTFHPVPKSTTCRYRFTQSIIVLIIGLIVWFLFFQYSHPTQLFQEIITTCDVRLLMSIPTTTLNSTTIMHHISEEVVVCVLHVDVAGSAADDDGESLDFLWVHSAALKPVGYTIHIAIYNGLAANSILKTPSCPCRNTLICSQNAVAPLTFSKRRRALVEYIDIFSKRRRALVEYIDIFSKCRCPLESHGRFSKPRHALIEHIGWYSQNTGVTLSNTVIHILKTPSRSHGRFSKPRRALIEHIG
ncbi:hypothetical protein A0H81_14165 [Grifola frondosa]|uniref:Uncharacterized protein n=1 Tax=Grifola frondosa TaxID=5627 RepID=A0A1C7LMG5_GRIFR|nr:hypothetical protein A0H81_14165 [Grifola frondosa]